MEWNIQARAHACQSCQRKFADKETFHTLLFDEKGGYERFDVCQKCWEEQFSQGATEKKGFVSYWQTVYTVPPAAPPEPILRESAEGLLRKLIELNDPKHGAALYVLGAMLERKRILKVKAQLAKEGQRVFVYEHGKTGDLFHIPDPNLQLDQLEAVQHEVLNLLQHGLGEGDGQQGATVEGEESQQTAESETQAADSKAGVEEGAVAALSETSSTGAEGEQRREAQKEESKAEMAKGKTESGAEEGSQEGERVNAA